MHNQAEPKQLTLFEIHDKAPANVLAGKCGACGFKFMNQITRMCPRCYEKRIILQAANNGQVN